jgi:hypothetical protein
MFLNLFQKYFKLKSSGDLAPSAEESRGTSVGYSEQMKINALKPKLELAASITDRNRWVILSGILGLALLLALLGWYQADIRFSNHVKVAFVKLDNSGSHTISFYDEASKVPYNLNTINSLLSEYVERRFSKTPYSIRADYGKALIFMSPQLQEEFRSNYQAAKVASDLESCKSCQQIKVEIRTWQHEENNEAILNGQSNTIFRTTFFIRETTLNPDGSIISRANKIVTLTWWFHKNVSELADNLDMLRADPLGIEILAESLKADPTPVNDSI